MSDAQCKPPCAPVVPVNLGTFPDINTNPLPSRPGDESTQPAIQQPLTNEQLRASAVPVTGPITNAQYSAVVGTAATPNWSGTGNGTLIAIQKAIYAQNVEIITLLGQIEENTRPTP